MAKTMEERIAHLEGAYQQIDRRLGNVEQDLRALRAEVVAGFERLSDRFGGIDTRLDGLTRWFGGLMLTSWVTLMAAIYLHH